MRHIVMYISTFICNQNERKHYYTHSDSLAYHQYAAFVYETKYSKNKLIDLVLISFNIIFGPND